MKIDAWWFNNKQSEGEILQPDFFIPKTNLGLYAEGEALIFPIQITVSVYFREKVMYEKHIAINEPKVENEEFNFYISVNDGIIMGSLITNRLETLPEHINVQVKSGDNIYSQTICCEYATISGKITDFSNNPFPAAFMLHRESFDGYIGVWSNKNGEYSITVPKGRYNTFYIDDNSYKKSSLENWGWHMIVDKDEKHDFKIGTGEVYSLCTWVNNGGFSTLFIFFRPMVLNKSDNYQIEINGNHFNVTDISPELSIDDITATINGYELKKITLQKIYETGDKDAMPAYILQVHRYPKNSGYSVLGKQTLIVEYNKKTENGYMMQSQGRTQFFYNNICALSLL